ncbi:ATP-binding protein [Actinomadura sp. WMMA1423]|uniref:ATP-binding protein n=1 Tax=Actinomadura sp. WMMA1423 TaxID=2591108 RepID=UPI001146C9AB|nr:ATP-binding protein [Actinomadura sp. WMMA1423]
MTMLEPLIHRETVSVDLTVIHGLTGQAVAQVRAWSAMTLERWGVPRLVGDTSTVLTELVTNSCQAEAGDLLVLIEWHQERDQVLIAVWDDAPGLPAKRELDYIAESGRGLHLVEALSSAWGHRPDTSGPGKTVWARLPAPDGGGTRPGG